MSFGNSQNWILFYNQKYSAKFIERNAFVSMGEKSVTLLFQYPLIGVLVKTYKDRPNTWKYAGKINQFLRVNIRTNINYAGINSNALLKSYPLELDKINLIVLDQLSLVDSVISYVPPKWFPECELTIWQYTENFAVTIDDKIAEIKAIAQNINSEITSINSNITNADLYGLP